VHGLTEWKRNAISKGNAKQNQRQGKFKDKDKFKGKSKTKVKTKGRAARSAALPFILKSGRI
jgi:hypothetical protein